jgi:multiple sugar transport system ATP-binding protein
VAEIRLVNVVKKYDKVLAVAGIDLEVSEKEFVVLVGPSGCGKSTILRMIAGLEEVTSGHIFIGGREVTNVVPKDRDIAMVFQNYALYPHMNVRKNMSFGLKMRKFSKSEIERRVTEAAGILNISELLDRKPKELSGGQRQRVAMGRAIVRDPKAFLFDEPLSNLDAKLRIQMRSELAKLHRRLGRTIIYVTHDQIEAMTLADRIVVLNKGEVMQIGRPAEVYENPRNLFVAGFIGSPTMNFMKVFVNFRGKELWLTGQGIELLIPEQIKNLFARAAGKEAIVGIRPEHIHTPDTRSHFPGDQRIRVHLEVVEYVGSQSILMGIYGLEQITACVDPLARALPQQTVDLVIDMSRMYLFDPVSGLAY